MHSIHRILLSSSLLTLTIAQPTSNSQPKPSSIPVPTLDYGVPVKGVTCATSQGSPNSYTGAAIVAAINTQSTADWVYYQQWDSLPPPGQFANSQMGTDATGKPYTMVWPANCNVTDAGRPMYPVSIGARDYALYQTTEPPVWRLDLAPTQTFCGVVTNSDAPASAGDAQTLAAYMNEDSRGIPGQLQGLHQCNED